MNGFPTAPFNLNPIFQTDSYKVSHAGFTAEGTEVIYSNLTARSFKIFQRHLYSLVFKHLLLMSLLTNGINSSLVVQRLKLLLKLIAYLMVTLAVLSQLILQNCMT